METKQIESASETIDDNANKTVEHAVHAFSGISLALLADDNDSSHQRWVYSVVDRMLSKASLMEDEDDIPTILHHMGCRQDFLHLIGARKNGYGEHCTLAEIFENVVQIAISCTIDDIPKDERGFPLYCSALPTNSWTSLATEQLYQETTSDETSRRISVYLCDLPSSFAEVQRNYLFHGTTWESAMNIVMNGIDRTQGRANTDFGPKCFYLSPSFKMAFDWAKMKGALQAAIVVYSDDWMEQFESKMTFDDPANELWKSNVFFFRHTNASNRRFHVDAHRDFGIMQGPLCRNVRQIDTLSDFHGVRCINDGTIVPKQVAIRLDEVARVADNNVVGIIFLPANSTTMHIIGRIHSESKAV